MNESAQTSFSCVIYQFGAGYKCSKHLTMNGLDQTGGNNFTSASSTSTSSSASSSKKATTTNNSSKNMIKNKLATMSASNMRSCSADPRLLTAAARYANIGNVININSSHNNNNNNNIKRFISTCQQLLAAIVAFHHHRQHHLHRHHLVRP